MDSPRSRNGPSCGRAARAWDSSSWFVGIGDDDGIEFRLHGLGEILEEYAGAVHPGEEYEREHVGIIGD
jgi:hypothetical protein